MRGRDLSHHGAYSLDVIADSEIPQASNPLLQHALKTYASETNKTASVFLQFGQDDLSFRPHIRSRTVLGIFRHQLLSERRFFAEFLGSPEPDPSEVLPQAQTAEAFTLRLSELAQPRFPRQPEGCMVA